MNDANPITPPLCGTPTPSTKGVADAAGGGISPRTLTTSWVLLILATVATWFLGEWSQLHGSAGTIVVFAMLAIALVKGRLVIDDFMALRHVMLRWRLLVMGWLAALLGLIAVAYWLGTR